MQQNDLHEFINWFDMVNWQPQTNSKVDTLSVCYSLEQMSYLTLKHQLCHFFPVANLPNRLG